MAAQKSLPVRAQRDYLESIAQTRDPFVAIAELIWNALDADAMNVNVRLVCNPLEGIEEIRVSDDGSGIPFDQAEATFGHLGGSWKVAQKVTSKRHRELHGRTGKGRFKALALGSQAKWISR
jgi:DNA topoisomerase VI subunit B